MKKSILFTALLSLIFITGCKVTKQKSAASKNNQTYVFKNTDYTTLTHFYIAESDVITAFYGEYTDETGVIYNTQLSSNHFDYRSYALNLIKKIVVYKGIKNNKKLVAKIVIHYKENFTDEIGYLTGVSHIKKEEYNIENNPIKSFIVKFDEVKLIDLQFILQDQKNNFKDFKNPLTTVINTNVQKTVYTVSLDDRITGFFVKSGKVIDAVVANYTGDNVYYIRQTMAVGGKGGSLTQFLVSGLEKVEVYKGIYKGKEIIVKLLFYYENGYIKSAGSTKKIKHLKKKTYNIKYAYIKGFKATGDGTYVTEFSLVIGEKPFLSNKRTTYFATDAVDSFIFYRGWVVNGIGTSDKNPYGFSESSKFIGARRGVKEKIHTKNLVKITVYQGLFEAENVVTNIDFLYKDGTKKSLIPFKKIKYSKVKEYNVKDKEIRYTAIERFGRFLNYFIVN